MENLFKVVLGFDCLGEILYRLFCSFCSFDLFFLFLFFFFFFWFCYIELYTSACKLTGKVLSYFYLHIYHLQLYKFTSRTLE